MMEYDEYWCECEKHHIGEKDYVWNSTTRNCENGKYLASMMDDSVITCDEVIVSHDKETKTIPTNVNEKNKTKYQAKHLLLFHGIKS